MSMRRIMPNSSTLIFPHLTNQSTFPGSFPENHTQSELFSEYLSQLTCPIGAFQVLIFGNYLLCCTFWMAHDYLMARIESKCSRDAVFTLSTYRETILPQIRGQCPADSADNSTLGSCALFTGSLFFLGGLLLLLLLWSILVTIIWVRLRKQNTTKTNKQLK